MKKYILPTLLSLMLCVSGQAQKLNKKQADKLVHALLHSLSHSDTTAFQQFWLVDQSPWPYHSRSYTSKDVTGGFYYLRTFLDTAIQNQLQPLRPEITKLSAREEERQFGEYHIQVWFNYSKVYQKGFGLFLVYHEGEWKCRFDPETSCQYLGPREG